MKKQQNTREPCNKHVMSSFARMTRPSRLTDGIKFFARSRANKKFDHQQQQNQCHYCCTPYSTRMLCYSLFTWKMSSCMYMTSRKIPEKRETNKMLSSSCHSSSSQSQHCAPWIQETERQGEGGGGSRHEDKEGDMGEQQCEKRGTVPFIIIMTELKKIHHYHYNAVLQHSPQSRRGGGGIHIQLGGEIEARTDTISRTDRTWKSPDT